MGVSGRVYWSGWAAKGCMAYVLCSESWSFDCTVSSPSNEVQQTYLTAKTRHVEINLIIEENPIHCRLVTQVKLWVPMKVN